MDTIDATHEEKIINVQRAPSKGKRIITIIVGVPKEQIESVLKYLKNSLGCGGSVNKETGDIQLQGDCLHKIEGELNKKLPEYKVIFGSKK